MAENRRKTLQATLRRITLRNAAATFVAVAVVACVLFVVSARRETERQITMAADLATYAYRPMILQGSVRDAEIQLSTALNLGDRESIVVRKPDLTAIYPLRDSDAISKCAKVSQVCWSGFFGAVSVLVPIYFDEVERGNLFGYLELTREIAPIWPESTFLLFAIFTIFGLVSYRQYSNLRTIVRELSGQFAKWAGKLELAALDAETEETEAPYTELLDLQKVVNGFQVRLRAFEEDAKQSARVDLLREIGHDLRTPLAQLSQAIALHLDTVETLGKSDPDEVASIRRALTHMGELIRQIRALNSDIRNGRAAREAVCDLSKATETFSRDFKKSVAIVEKKIKISCSVESGLESEIGATEFYRILDNLTRNAVDASPICGGIKIELIQVRDEHVLRISDEGPGVPMAIRNRIFDFNFTTKSTRGTGLGLGIVRSLCRAHGGDARLCEDKGSGATFEAHLPARRKNLMIESKNVGVENVL